jgi:hypothetical protein
MNLFKRIFGGTDQSDKTLVKRKIKLEKLLSSEDIKSSINELEEYVYELCLGGGEMDKLTEEQKVFYYNKCLESAVNINGFMHYFLSSSGKFAHPTVQSLQAIGAIKTAELLQRAIDQFPDKVVPLDREVRQELIDSIDVDVVYAWDELDLLFYAYEENLDTLNLEFIRKNKDKFLNYGS